MKIIGEFTYLGERMSIGGLFEAAVTARTRCWWVKHMECAEMVCIKMSSTVESDRSGSVRIAMLCVIEV